MNAPINGQPRRRPWAGLAWSIVLVTAAGTAARAPFDDNLDTLVLAIELYEGGDFEDAAALLGNVDRTALDDGGRRRYDQARPQIHEAGAQISAARGALRTIDQSLRNRDYETARQNIQAVMGNAYAPADLKHTARERLSMVQFRQRQQLLAAPLEDPGPDRSARLDEARQHLGQATASLKAKDWQSAQDHYSLASWYWPDAEVELVYIDPRDGATFTRLPPARLHAVEVLVPVRNVTMNLQLGAGRLVGLESFQFSGSPVAGVGASGFVQLPNVQRVQIKTTVTAPAVEIRPPTVQHIEVSERFVVLVRPRF